MLKSATLLNVADDINDTIQYKGDRTMKDENETVVSRRGFIKNLGKKIAVTTAGVAIFSLLGDIISIGTAKGCEYNCTGCTYCTTCTASCTSGCTASCTTCTYCTSST
jgi:hypothetical protein